MIRVIVIFVILTLSILVPIIGLYESLTCDKEVLNPIKNDIAAPAEIEIVFEKETLTPIKNDIVAPAEIEIVFEKIVRVSWYNPWDKKQTDDSPGICAWGYEAKRGDRILAISRDFLNLLEDGQEVEVGDYGKYIVRDKMNKRFKNAIDIAVTDHNLDESQLNKIAFKNGVKSLVLRWSVVIAND